MVRKYSFTLVVIVLSTVSGFRNSGLVRSGLRFRVRGSLIWLVVVPSFYVFVAEPAESLPD